jgi:hypothetical protein
MPKIHVILKKVAIIPYFLQRMHPVVLTYPIAFVICHNTTLKGLFTSTVYNEFIDLNGVLLHVSA